jgi:hypothetical protein
LDIGDEGESCCCYCCRAAELTRLLCERSATHAIPTPTERT